VPDDTGRIQRKVKILASTRKTPIFAGQKHLGMRKHSLLFLLALLTWSLPCTLQAAAPAPFTIVIDPGHGGKDPGALGSIVREKDVVLDVALRFGRLINRHHPEVKVIYTRNTDVFIPLEQRAKIANKANANLFISIHADYAENKSAKGPTTFTLGQSRSKENFEIAKRENAVILLEDNYEQRYEGFDPNSAESYIMFEFMQDNYMSQSIELASVIQSKFKDSGRNDRGVRQDIFLVLRHTSMPSVLVELGFLTNKEEEVYLKSDKGKEELAGCLLKAFTQFKSDYDRKNGVKPATASAPTNTSTTTASTASTATTTSKQTKPVTMASSETAQPQGVIFRIQVFTVATTLPRNDPRFKGYSLDHYVEKGFNKYTYGTFTDFSSASNKRKELLADFPDAFIIAFKDGVRLPVNEARTLASSSNP
jgi:N-acetylmuramoyl-L-alanine amidase